MHALDRIAELDRDLAALGFRADGQPAHMEPLSPDDFRRTLRRLHLALDVADRPPPQGESDPAVRAARERLLCSHESSLLTFLMRYVPCDRDTLAEQRRVLVREKIELLVALRAKQADGIERLGRASLDVP